MLQMKLPFVDTNHHKVTSSCFQQEGKKAIGFHERAKVFNLNFIREILF